MPVRTSTPWAIVLNVGITVLVWPDGRVQINIIGDATAEAERLEKILAQRFGLERKSVAEYKRECVDSPQRITYGVAGDAARGRSQVRGFRLAQSPWIKR